LYCIQEYVDGADMQKLIEETRKFSELETAMLMKKILEAINHIHSIGVVHRDLKPENIMITTDHEPKLIDFGLSKDTGPESRNCTTMVGSKMYMAPELVQNISYSKSCDLWSVGIILFMMLSADYPFSSSNLDYEIVNEPIFFM
jgi:serine/threonine protein kinase